MAEASTWISAVAGTLGGNRAILCLADTFSPQKGTHIAFSIDKNAARRYNKTTVCR